MSLNGPAAARLYDEHVDAVYAYAARRVGAEAAVRVVEEVFEQALRKNAQRPPHTGSDLGWLLAMATAFLRRHSATESRRLLDWQPVQRETSRAIPRVTDPLLSDDTEDPTVTLTAQVMAAVADLEPVERDVLFLVAWEGCSSALTATATGLPQNEIRPTLQRIRKQIRSAVAASLTDDAATAATGRPGAATATVPSADGAVVRDPAPELVPDRDPELVSDRDPDPEPDPDATEPIVRADDPFEMPRMPLAGPTSDEDAP